jgi:hypothetical protein
LLQVNGNLRHRIEKLGSELDEHRLTASQLKLRQLAKAMSFDEHFDGPPKRHDRPAWANGAFVYLSAEHCKGIKEAIRDAGVQLMAKHVLVTPKYKHIVEDVLNANPEATDRTGRDAYCWRRVRAQGEEEKIYLPGRHSYESDWHRDMGVQLQYAEAADRTGRMRFPVRRDGLSDADRKIYRRCKSCFDRDWCRGLCGFSSYDPLQWYSPCTCDASSRPMATCDASSRSMAPKAYNMETGRRGRNNIAAAFLQLNNDIMELRHIDMDLLEYLTSPPSVQILTPEMWKKACEHVCQENWWIEMRVQQPTSEHPYRPYCTMCDKWAMRLHLKSDKCKRNRTNKMVNCGPLLTAMLTADSW